MSRYPNALETIRTAKLKLTQAELAKALGKHQSTVCRWENGSLALDMPAIQAIRAVAESKGIELSADDFFAPEAAA